ncbi:MAG: ABC transporter permease [Vicinamibacterales bacterium]
MTIERTAGVFASRSRPWSIFATTWRYRELLWHLVSRNIRVQYKQSILGYAWILLNPISQLVTLSFIFSVVFPAQSQFEAPFALFLFIGLLPWVFFSNAVSAATESISGAANMITSVYFPRELLVLASVLVRVVDLIGGAIILAVLILFTGQPLGWAYLWLPVLLTLQIIFVCGMSMPLAALNLYFHDVRYLTAVVLYLWFFFTPIFYSLTAVPERYRWVWDLNPNSRFNEAYRYALLENISPPIESVIAVVVFSVVALVVGYFLFKGMEPGFADQI